MFVGYSKVFAGAVFALGLSMFGTLHAAPDPLPELILVPDKTD